MGNGDREADALQNDGDKAKILHSLDTVVSEKEPPPDNLF